MSATRSLEAALGAGRSPVVTACVIVADHWSVNVAPAEHAVSGNSPMRESTKRDAVAARAGGRLGVIGGLAALLALLMLGASLVGAYPISLAEMAAAFARRLAGAPAQGQIETVLFEVRLPRVLAAVLVGAALAAAGAAYQTLFRNPL